MIPERSTCSPVQERYMGGYSKNAKPLNNSVI